MRHYLKSSLLTIFTITLLTTGLNAAPEGKAKYCFFFIGDGMASPQIHATESFLAAKQYGKDDIPENPKQVKLIMRKFPASGTQTNHAINRLITDSAAAGTALACGNKTNVGMVSQAPDSSKFTTIAEAAKAAGMKVGIVTSVSIDHATPAVFYAHTSSRNNFDVIDQALLDSNFDYFGGGGMIKRDAKFLDNYAQENENFTYTDTRAEFEALSEANGKVLAVNPYLDIHKALPYSINTGENTGNIKPQYDGTITLSEFTQKGIDLMKDHDKGFFMMVEGGKIDWACHANDGCAAISDVISFTNAVSVAIEFAKDHPDETLIVVTGDHECGGMTLGFAGTDYRTFYERLTAQNIAFDDFVSIKMREYKPSGEDIDQNMKDLINECFGLNYDDLTKYEKKLIESAFDKSMDKRKYRKNMSQEDRLLYGEYDPLTTTVTHLLNRKSGLSWTSFSHTAVPLPVMATGTGAEYFIGNYDNTDIPKKIAQALQISFN